MSLVVSNNVASLTAQHNLFRSSSMLNKSLERLSSGYRINRGADGPAALVISEQQRAQIAGLEKAIQNTEKGVAVVQTAEGALNEINSLLVKIRSLALDSANAGVNDVSTLAANQAEIDNALDTINRIANNTQFGTKKLLDGSAGVAGSSNDTDVSFIRGTSATIGGQYAVNVTTAGERATWDAADPTGTGVAQTGPLAADETLTINNIAISLNAGMTQAQVISRINEFTSQTGVQADDTGTGSATRLFTVGYGSAQSVSVVSDTAAAVDSSGFGLTEQSDDGVDVVATIGGTSFTGVGDVVTATSGNMKGISLRFSAASSFATVTGAQGDVTVDDQALVFQIGANQGQTAKVAINKVNPDALGFGIAGNQFASLNDINIDSADKADDALGVIDAAINEITTQRGALGAFQQNTLESTANNLRATLENTVSAESVVRDTDFASEIANFTKAQVLVQAGTSILSSANQTSQLVLSLL